MKIRIIQNVYYEEPKKKVNSFELKTVLNQLFEECKHGDQEHQDWLKNKFEEFYNKIIE